MAFENETAAQGVGSLNGGKTEKLGSVFQTHKYTATTFSTMPSTERSGLLARVVAKGGRLFAVGHYAGGAL